MHLLEEKLSQKIKMDLNTHFNFFSDCHNNNNRFSAKKYYMYSNGSPIRKEWGRNREIFIQ